MRGRETPSSLVCEDGQEDYHVSCVRVCGRIIKCSVEGWAEELSSVVCEGGQEDHQVSCVRVGGRSFKFSM